MSSMDEVLLLPPLIALAFDEEEDEEEESMTLRFFATDIVDVDDADDVNDVGVALPPPREELSACELCEPGPCIAASRRLDGVSAF